MGTGENINEGPLGYPFPRYAERAARMSEALEIMRRLLDGEKLDFDGEYGGGGTGRLYYNDRLVGEGRIDKTVPNIFSADETLDIGCDLALPVTDEYPVGEANAFQGKLHWVRIDLEDDDVSHEEPDDLKYKRMMARQ